jgi:hypothetical protein
VTRLPAVAQIAIWAEIGTIAAARFYDGWFGRVLFLSPDPEARMAFLSDPYSAVLARTAPWAAGIAGALAVMAGCLIRLRGTRRPQADASRGSYAALELRR